MGEVKLRAVTFAELSGLRHEVAVADGPQFHTPDFLVIRYFGVYKHGSAGRGDALYIVATAAAARKAWWSPCTVIDFSELEYRWGDEMAWVTSVVWDRILRTHAALAVVVGDRCRDALRSLLREEYEQFCVESLEQAFESCRRQALVYDQRLKEFRGQAEPSAAADRGGM
jgi:hypothetical protein